MEEKLIVFSDQIGRIVAGVEVSETETSLTVRNPVIVHIEPQSQTGQLSVHTFPYIFMEIVNKDARESNEWTFNKSNIVTSNVQLDEKLAQAVRNVNSPASPIVTPDASDAKIVNLFDGE